MWPQNGTKVAKKTHCSQPNLDLINCPVKGNTPGQDMETKWCTNNLCNNATATWNETQINSLGWNSHEYLLKKNEDELNVLFHFQVL